MMLGGAAQGSYADLFSQWSAFYPILQQTLQQYKLNGIDLDIEENVSLSHAEALINRLNTDFGSQFLITMAPVASALWGGANLSGFSYQQLYQSSAGAKIAWFNGQFYSGFATMSSTTVNSLATQYPRFGGVVAWEYFNAAPGGSGDPIEWAVDMAKAMR